MAFLYRTKRSTRTTGGARIAYGRSRDPELTPIVQSTHTLNSGGTKYEARDAGNAVPIHKRLMFRNRYIVVSE